MTSANLSARAARHRGRGRADPLPPLVDAWLRTTGPSTCPATTRSPAGARRRASGPRSRGYVPLPIRLGRAPPPLLAVGADLKNALRLAEAPSRGSPPLGDMDDLSTQRAFDPDEKHLDGHPPRGPRTCWRPTATRRPIHRRLGPARRGRAGRPPGTRAAPPCARRARLAEHGRLVEPSSASLFDGTGYGNDGAVWGGEVLLSPAATPASAASPTWPTRPRCPAATRRCATRAGPRSATWPPPGSAGIPPCRR